jgi:hypothetical protein
VPRFLSPDWIDALARAAAAQTLPEGTPAAAVEVEVRGPAGDRVVWVLEIAPPALRVAAGPSAAATVRLHCDEATAAALATGALNAQLAVAGDRLRIEGDLATLPGLRAAFEALGDVFAAVRADTDFPRGA